MERTVSRVRPATEPPSGVWPDLRIIAIVGSRLFPDLFADGSPDPETVYDEFRELTAGTVADVSGITYDRLAEEKAVRWPAADETESGGYRYHEDGTWSFPTASGRAEFSTGRQGDLPEPTDDDYPLTLTTAREPDGYNTGVRSRDVDDPGPLPARVNPGTVADREGVEADEGVGADADDAAAEEATDPDAALATRRGVVPVTVDPDPAVPEGLVWVPIHHPLANRLTVDALDPQSKEPNFKQCAARLVASAASVAATTDRAVGADD